MRIKRFFGDLKYMILNTIINRIPFWCIRKFLYKCLGVKIAKGSRIGIKTVVVCPQKIIIGENTIINEFCHIDGRGGLKIGNNCSISIYSKIISASHNGDSNSFSYTMGRVTIKDNVWIGCNATVLDDSILEDFCIVGAGAVFKGISEEKGIYLGVPAKLKRKRKIDEKYKINYRPFFR